MVEVRKLSFSKKLLDILSFIIMGISLLFWLMTVIGFYYIYNWPKILSVFVFFLLLFLGWFLRNKKIFIISVIIGFSVMMTVLSRIKPSNNRDWDIEGAVLPRINISNHQLIIRNFRDFQWQSEKKVYPIWGERLFDLRKLKSLDFIVEPFKDSELMAHTMLRFGFGEDNYLIVSVEARREKNEKFSLVAGALRQFELIYIFGSEEDLLTLRAVHRGTRLYVYPVKADHNFIVNLFLDLVDSANALHSEPKFYRSIRDNCTTTLVKHVDRQFKEHIGFRYETLFPVLVGRLLYRMGYMDTSLSYEEAQKYFRVDEKLREQYQKKENE